MGRRIYPLRSIKYWYCYDVEEICTLYKAYRLNVQTVRAWIKQGLHTIDNGKPSLIYGHDLKQFLGKLNLSHKCSTAFEQFFCMKCKEATAPFKKQVVLEPTPHYVKAKSQCQTCKTTMHKNYKMGDIPRLRISFKLVGVLELYDSNTSPLKTHILHDGNTPKTEPAQGRLF